MELAQANTILTNLYVFQSIFSLKTWLELLFSYLFYSLILLISYILQDKWYQSVKNKAPSTTITKQSNMTVTVSLSSPQRTEQLNSAPFICCGNGVNLQPSYYNSGEVDFGWSLMKKHSKIKTVRIEIEPDIPISLASSWIRQAVENGYAVIATYHKHTVLGSNNQGQRFHLKRRQRWWKYFIEQTIEISYQFSHPPFPLTSLL